MLECVTSSFGRVLIIATSLLGAVERQLVMNLLWLDLPIQTSTMSSWVTREGKAWAHPLFSVWLCAIIAYG
jgi:hypothetical protein